MRSSVLLLLLLLPITTGCPSNSSNSGPSYEQICHDFVDAACSANAHCAVTNGKITSADYDKFMSDCRAGAALTLDCSRVRGINGSIDACEADYAAEPCSFYQEPTGLPVPPSCKGLLVL